MTEIRSPDDIAVGDSLPTLRFGPVTRAMLARYAAASLDFNPIHIDTDFARAAWRDDVIAHGMLSFSLAARLVSEWAGADTVRRIAGRFTAITHVGDEIAVSGRVRAIKLGTSNREIEVELTARVKDKETIVAEALIARPFSPNRVPRTKSLLDRQPALSRSSFRDRA